MNSVKTAHEDWNAEAYKLRRSWMSLKGKRQKSNFGLPLPSPMVPTPASKLWFDITGKKTTMKLVKHQNSCPEMMENKLFLLVINHKLLTVFFLGCLPSNWLERFLLLSLCPFWSCPVCFYLPEPYPSSMISHAWIIKSPEAVDALYIQDKIYLAKQPLILSLRV